MPPAEVFKAAPKSKGDELFQYEGSDTWFGCNPDSIVKPRVAKAGVAGPSTPTSTLPALFKKAASGPKGNKDALLVERPVPALKDGRAPPPLPRQEWKKWTMKMYHDDVRKLAKGFMSLGFKQYDTVCIWGFNAPEWNMSAMAGMYAGGKCGGLYPTDTPETAAYKVVHSGGAIITIDDRSKIDKLLPALNERKDCTRVKAIIAWGFEPAKDEKVTIEGCGEVPLFSWSAALEMGASKVSDEDLDKVADAIDPGSCAGLIYTSGTTGDPKAVMISHDNCIFSAVCTMSVFKVVGFMQTASEERILSYLPQSHVVGLMLDVVCAVVDVGQPGWIACFYARQYDLKVGTIGERLSIARPTVFMGVPLVWEKMADKIRAIGAAGGGCAQRVSGWAKGTLLERARNMQMGESGQGGNSCAAKLMGAVKERVGLDLCKIAITGAAPIRVDTLEYFGSLNLHINEAYGMSESCGGVTFSTDVAHIWGSCGYAGPGCEVATFKVSDTNMNDKTPVPAAPTATEKDEKYMGEICFRGRGIMMGYLACPDMGEAHVAEITKKTAETIDKEGWLHSGDKGLVTQSGMLKITGRYKELIIGEGGENIAPVPIEDSIKGLVDGINEVMMIGDKRKYNVAVITLKAVGANGEVPGTDDLDMGAKRVNPSVKTISAAMKDKTWIDVITKALNETNSNSKIVANNAMKIQKFTILPTNFSEAGGELTPTKKLKRKIVENKFEKIIEKMYATEGVYIPHE
jgi:long-chain-fatty-acid--CoA ligase ACSBG